MTRPTDYADKDCPRCHGEGFTYDGRFRLTCDCVIDGWRTRNVTPGSAGTFYTPQTVFDPAAGTGVYLASIIANPPYGTGAS